MVTIHAFAERMDSQGNWQYVPGIDPFDLSDYTLYAWLADVRNYSDMTPIAQPRGLPADASAHVAELFQEHRGAHGCSWLSVDELLAFDYDAPCEDCVKYTEISPGYSTGARVPAGQGIMSTYRKIFEWSSLFDDLADLRAAGAGRVVVWFD